MATKSDEICQRTTQGQIKCYIEFCKKHPEISKTLSKKYGKTSPLHVQELWSELAERLNSMRGPTRSVKKWQEAFSTWKSTMRYRARKTDQTGASSRYEDLLQFFESKNQQNDEVHLKKIRQPEKSPNGHQTTTVGKAASGVELTFDSIFLPCDGVMDSTSSTSSSRSPSPASEVSMAPETKKTKTKKIKTKKTKKSVNSKQVNFSAVCNTIIKSIEERREREEIFSINQQNIITKLDKTLTAMNHVLEKINDKLNTGVNFGDNSPNHFHMLH